MYIDNIEIFVNELVPEGAIRISWSKENVGFGQLDLILENNKLYADTEYMCTNEDKKFLKEVFNKLIDEIEVIS